MPDVTYAITRSLGRTSFDEAVARTKEALGAEGFGILSEIDVAATLNKKLGVERPPYLLLGACNPALAHRALEAEPSLGVLLPCNVDLFVDPEGTTWVQAIDPRTVFRVVDNPAVGPVAEEVAGRLTRALDAVAGG